MYCPAPQKSTVFESIKANRRLIRKNDETRFFNFGDGIFGSARNPGNNLPSCSHQVSNQEDAVTRKDILLNEL